MPNSLENVAAKAAGKAAAFRAHANGLTGVFAKLSEQHREAGVLLKRVAASDDVSERRDLWTTLRRELLSHEQAELITVYSVLEQHASIRDIALRHSDEAETLEAAISDVDRAGVDSPDWQPLMQRLVGLIQRHVDEEEHEYFPRAQQAIGNDKARELEGPFTAARERLLESLR